MSGGPRSLDVVTHCTQGHGLPLASLWYSAPLCADRGLKLRFLHTNKPSTLARVLLAPKLLFDSVASLRHGFGALCYWASVLLRKRMAIFWHETDWAIERTLVDPGTGQPLKRLRARTVRHLLANPGVTHFHVCTYGTRMLVERYGVAAERVHLLHGCSNSAALLAHPLPLPVEPGLFVAVGDLNARKGVDLFLEIARRVVQSRPEARFVWIGTSDGNLEYTESSSQAKAEALGLSEQVSFIGWQDDPVALMAKAEAILLTSRDDPLPKILQEALALGRKSVAFDVGGAAEILGEEGRVVPPGDCEAFADQLIEPEHCDSEAQFRRRRR